MKVSLETTRWLLHDSRTEPARMFNTPTPHYCKLCDEAVPAGTQARHRAIHLHTVESETAERQVAALELAREARRERKRANANG